MDYRLMTAPCGLDCFNCPVHLSKDNEKLRKLIASARNIPEGRVACSGCRNHNGTIPFVGMSEPCDVYKCITAKGLDFCSDCADFPCDFLHPYADRASEVPHNTKVFNLALIKKMGLQKWAEDKAAEVKSVYFKGKFKL